MSKFHQKPVTHINHVTLKVFDLEQSIKFYKEILGFHILTFSENEAQLTANKVNPLITLVQLNNPIRKKRNTTGLYHVAILLPTRDDLAQFLQHLIDRKIRIGTSDHHVSEAIYLNDPDGNGIEVYCDRPAESWTWVHEQVTMMTERLDVTNLLAVKTKKWDVIPEGALLGHLHLSVNEYERSKQFYEALGFTVVTEYTGAAFMSFGKYHHHLAMNTWNGVNAPNPNANEPGLQSFVIIYGSNEIREAAIHNLHQLNINVEKVNNNYIVHDFMNTEIVLSL